jgi:hypothetical protein
MPQAILVSNWLISKKIFSSETAWPNKSKLGREHPWKVLHLTKRFQRRRLKKIGQSEKTIAYGSHVC